ncbi:hypothetical protein [Halalkalibacter krulwichiae]|uniref:Uncharacterized protein n=1 Tax=Halalkalibacter krulwichiae TaxID=199441 RepID=A0A1X9MIT7_9BACI|nr:hypothetical protein [Halalkalibacter krulwichiae]ARK32714.1 hypothetical protein BkAM31D_24230 [Halalkalibacter krulwichiae]
MKLATQKEFNLLVKLQDIVDFAVEFTPPGPEPPAVCECEIIMNAQSDLGDSTLNLTVQICPGCDPEATSIFSLTLTEEDGTIIAIPVDPNSIQVTECALNVATIEFEVELFGLQFDAQLEINGTDITLRLSIPDDPGVPIVLSFTGAATVRPCPLSSNG